MDRTDCYECKPSNSGDLMVSIIVPIRIIDFEGILRWTLATCRLQTAIRYWPVFLSIDTMLLIAIERHVAVVRPLNFKRFVSRKNVFFQLVTVWLVSLVQVSYLVVRSKVVAASCYILWDLNQVHYVYAFIIIIPTVALLSIYGHLFLFARQRVESRVQPIASGSNQSRMSQRALSSARMLLLVALLFIVSWTPTMTLYYEAFLNPARFYGGSGVKLFQGFSLLIFGHSVMNPITYLVMSASFRASVTAALTSCWSGSQFHMVDHNDRFLKDSYPSSDVTAAVEGKLPMSQCKIAPDKFGLNPIQFGLNPISKMNFEYKIMLLGIFSPCQHHLYLNPGVGK
ncbi:hypothetical protein CAPTEDRAFT_189329 [Capitella teleta]|uniref:G-protein coupled receptors family 1 profile domain-containing protein n=1 Tax=Capitella teleta TaxID=283909 RepID=R7US12_CAPTE|nr:hypothetical protein CAPTEDRAFT_189329 [Capitella teleta]|eukprot:ELU06697.1 hypothetical protein CAPTEDRAFT_189329 [Capitella teleta]